MGLYCLGSNVKETNQYMNIEINSTQGDRGSSALRWVLCNQCGDAVFGIFGHSRPFQMDCSDSSHMKH